MEGDGNNHDALSAGPRHQPGGDTVAREAQHGAGKSRQARDGFSEAVGLVLIRQNHRYSCLRR